MTLLIVSLGSNVDASCNIGNAIESLREKFGNLTLSSVYESESIGFSGDNFLNLVISAGTDMTLTEVDNYLKELENSLGRDRDQPKFSDRTIDIDILVFGAERGEDCGLILPRREIFENAFVLKPLAEIHPDLKNPDTGTSYFELWEKFDQASQKLWVVNLKFED
ncbi:MAG: 2-amino-4-hydroxy-6-hydroxymethyldihydropteridine diphosphokinase [Gammaproteobacteria bacterium]|nr:2-amino-4-hydroxy-6-hydroxymethyldihydropteridine diphosphokinase [Gammaproteobacteria bacterium]|tara:strand:- start:465 stop:959 length:495 start_codon:yes stop_codon:yes gene_type:complete